MILLNALILVIALLHLLFMVLEMFLWRQSLGLKIFHTTPEFAQKTERLMANQGLYNAFLSVGLLWSVLASHSTEAFHLKAFFLSCVFIAGMFGGMTVNRMIFFIQGLPAFCALALLLIVK